MEQTRKLIQITPAKGSPPFAIPLEKPYVRTYGDCIPSARTYTSPSSLQVYEPYFGDTPNPGKGLATLCNPRFSNEE
ncbi:hypothetical protein [Dictyobacter arantiisoli]|uniref:Uncharacterized protein n=1 Tax=Dictyobacter arantiisoli TaxID=2014874 RepID=A0A5A5T7C2_9CHLR|nr:hypothetical protein [Dictyobacter arantiisoli]GCF06893.1 hypothetical protein KDI_04570 [Dictyobacter arantiisoli]